MNITYMVGNGFDIACGLKTRYTDFIKTYVASPSENSCIEEFKKIIEQDLCTWADAEFAFCKLTQKITKPEQFKECFNDFLDCMATYFSEQEATAKADKKKKSDSRKMIKGITDFQAYLSDESKETICECLADCDCVNYNLNFLIYSYTNVFERNLKQCRIAEHKVIELKTKDKNTCHCVNKSVLYAHGSLTKQPLIFGVNDVDQIEYLVHRTNRTIIRTLVKPTENEETHRITFERCKNAINKSDIIVVFGMSLGQTDSLWWKNILEWLAENAKANLIIHYWEPACNRHGAGLFIEAREELKNKFIAHAQANIHTPITLTNRIHIVFNKNPFNIVMHA